MPKLKTVSVTYGRKFNLGNYESAELSATLWVDFEPEDLDQDPNEIIADLYGLAKEAVKTQYVSLGESLRKSRERVLAKAEAEAAEESDD